MRSGRRRAALLLVPVVAVALAWLLRNPDEGARDLANSGTVVMATDAAVRGEYLARAGNCMHCHTQSGGADYAGGRAIETPFGGVYTSNLTPDAKTGLGAWSADDFWSAMHYGVSKGGRWLLPVFPYGNFTRVSRADSDAIYAYLRSVPAVSHANREHELVWPFDSQWALGLWRALFFRTQTFRADSSQSETWNRGAYLVQGLGHCGACHSARNALGASSDVAALAGGMIPTQNWYAPALSPRWESVVRPRKVDELVQLLQAGTSTRSAAMGPMAEVVLHSTQFLTLGDLTAMAVYLNDLPPVPDAHGATSKTLNSSGSVAPAGEGLYKDHCAHCHAVDGQGVLHAYPALAGSSVVNMVPPVNLVQIVLHGGFPPATSANPRPFGMPPFALSLSDHDIAAVLSYVRSAWGNRAGEVTPQDVDRLRGRSH